MQDFHPEEIDVKKTVKEFFEIEPTAKNFGNNDIEKHIQRLISKYLSEKKITSDIKLTSLAGLFQNSRIPDNPESVDRYIRFIEEQILNNAMRVSSPLFIGHMTTALPSFMRPLANLLVTLNQNNVKMETSRVLSPHERETLAMMHRLFFQETDYFYEKHIQRPDSTLGIMTSGGTIANITALWCARNAALCPEKNFQGVEIEGLPAALQFYGYRDAVIIGSDMMHYSFEKAIDIMGLGARNLIRVPTTQNNRIEIGKLKEEVESCQQEKKLIVGLVGVAGSTESGSVDDLEAMADIAANAGIHFHVDAAWGGPYLLSEKHAIIFKGITRADSVTVDGHKQMYLPMGNGMVLFRDPEKAACIEKSAPYVIRRGSTDLGKRSLEGSRPAFSLLLHTALHLLGKKGYGFLIDESHRKIQFLAERIHESTDFEIIVEPTINILLYRFIPKGFRKVISRFTIDRELNESINSFNERLQKRQREYGRTFISRTTVIRRQNGQAFPTIALRAVIANPLTTETDIIEVLEDQRTIAAELEID